MSNAATVYTLVFGVFGALVGSFLNVVIYRLPREDVPFLTPRRSYCPTCKRAIPWYENLPILSWVLLGARCRGCQTSIAARYVIVETLTAFLWGVFAWQFVSRGGVEWQDWAVFLAGLLLISACVAVTYIDLDFKIIPDEITWPGMILGLLWSVTVPLLQSESWLYQQLRGADLPTHGAALLSSAAGLLTGVLVVWGVGVLGTLVFRKEAMGLGDVKYLGLVGAFLGFDGVLLVFFLGCVTGAMGGLLHRWLTGSRYIAFGPYLSLGVLLVLYLRPELMRFFLEDWPELVRSLMGLALPAGS